MRIVGVSGHRFDTARPDAAAYQGELVVTLRNHTVPFLLFVVTGFILFGCAGAAKPVAAAHLYGLSVSRPGIQPPFPGGPVLCVYPFQADPPFDEGSFLIRQGSAALRQETDHVFETPPTVAIEQVASRWLEASGMFGGVAQPPNCSDSQYLLQGWVVALYAEQESKTTGASVLSVELKLVKRENGEQSVLVQQIYREMEPVISMDPDSLVAGWETSLERILARFEEDIRPFLDKDEGEEAVAAGRLPGEAATWQVPFPCGSRFVLQGSRAGRGA